MMNWMGRIGFVVVGVLTLSNCNFPPPSSTSDQSQYYQPRSSSAPVETEKLERTADSFAKLNDLQSQLDQLKGKVEVLGYELEQERNQNKRSFGDLDSRLSYLESSSNPMTSSSPITSDSEFNEKPAAPVKTAIAPSIDTWILQAKNGQELQTAIPNIESWIAKNPKDGKKLDASFALAKGYFEKGDFPRSVQNFQMVVDEFPQTGQACYARFYQGVAFVKLQDPKNAKLFFQETIELCPKHDARKKSEDEIKKIQS